MRGGGWTRGGKRGWVREGDVHAPSRAKRGSFFTGSRYLMHEKVFSLGQVHSSYQIFH